MGMSGSAKIGQKWHGRAYFFIKGASENFWVGVVNANIVDTSSIFGEYLGYGIHPKIVGRED